MKTIITYVISVLMSAMMVAAVGGISVIHHYCGCNEEVTASRYIEEEYCDHVEEIATTCCSNETVVSSCCSMDGSENHCNGNCCQTENEFFRLTDSFTAPVRQDILDINPVTIELPVEIALIENNFDQEVDGCVIEWDSSPPPSSLEIRSFLSRLTLSPPSVV